MKKQSLIKEKTHNDKLFTVFFAVVWSNSILMRYIRVLIMKVPFIWQHADTIISAAFIILFAISVSSMLRHLYIKELFIALVIYVVYYLYYLLYPENQRYYFLSDQIFEIEVMPMFIMGFCLYRIKREKTLELLFTLSLISVYVYTGYMVLFNTMGNKMVRSGDMHAAYTILPHVCMVFCCVMRKSNGWNVIAFIIGSVMLLFLGTRGALLCLFVFVTFTVLFSKKLKHPGLFLAISVFFLIVLFAFGLLDVLYEFAEAQGFSLRIFKKLESGEITDSSGRDKIQDRIVEYILMYPLMGLGIFSDRRIAGGYYAHNIILEMMLHYGIIIGTLLFVFLVVLFVKAYIALRKKEDEKSLYFLSSMLFSYGLKLFLSSSYLLEPYLFLAIGFSLAALKENRDLLKAELLQKKRDAIRLRRFS